MAKFCTSCGAPLDGAVKFCTNCGGQNTAPQPAPVPVASAQPQPYAPQLPPAQKQLKPPLLIVAAAALVALIAIIAISAHKGGPGPKPPSGDAAIAMKALAGNWGKHEKKLPYWVFGPDGRFAYYDAQSINNYDTYITSYYERWVQGKYSVSGYTIELYDCRVSSYFKYGRGWKYFDKSPYKLPANTLLDTPLPKSGGGSTTETKDDFTVMFEFQSATCLRLVMNNKLDQYDCDFDYDGDSHNVTLPTLRIPASEWPEAFVKLGMPKYDDGRIRYVGNRKSGDKVSEVNVEIDSSTPAYFEGYIDRLLQSGWSLEDDWGRESVYEKDGYKLTVGMYHWENGEVVVPGRMVYITLWTDWGSGVSIDDLF